ncbi:MAG: glycosyltransferase family 2 protein, partial [Blastocatellia bacterium]|nr:glycosyltransferase family 2 protein [Blastocatellia bacterium]
MRSDASKIDRVSVVIPCYNAAPFIRDTIDSVLCQTRPVDEVIVIDDGSVDGSADIAESFGGPVRVIRQSNRGEGGARNRGIREGKGEVIAFLDADDLWSSKKIEHQLKYLDKHPEIGAVTTNVAVFQGATIVRSSCLEDEFFRRLRPIDFLTSYYLNQSASVVRTELMRSVPYPENQRNNADMVHTAMLRTKTEIGRVEMTLVYCRIHPGKVTRTPDSYLFGAEFRLRWAKENYRLFGFESEAAATSPVVTTAVNWVLDPY